MVFSISCLLIACVDNVAPPGYLKANDALVVSDELLHLHTTSLTSSQHQIVNVAVFEPMHSAQWHHCQIGQTESLRYIEMIHHMSPHSLHLNCGRYKTVDYEVRLSIFRYIFCISLIWSYCNEKWYAIVPQLWCDTASPRMLRYCFTFDATLWYISNYSSVRAVILLERAADISLYDANNQLLHDAAQMFNALTACVGNAFNSDLAMRGFHVNHVVVCSHIRKLYHCSLKIMEKNWAISCSEHIWWR